MLLAISGPLLCKAQAACLAAGAFPAANLEIALTMEAGAEMEAAPLARERLRACGNAGGC